MSEDVATGEGRNKRLTGPVRKLLLTLTVSVVNDNSLTPGNYFL